MSVCFFWNFYHFSPYFAKSVDNLAFEACIDEFWFEEIFSPYDAFVEIPVFILYVLMVDMLEFDRKDMRNGAQRFITKARDMVGWHIEYAISTIFEKRFLTRHSDN